MKIGIIITETLSKTVIMDVPNRSEAFRKVRDAYRCGNVILDSDDHVETDFSIVYCDPDKFDTSKVVFLTNKGDILNQISVYNENREILVDMEILKKLVWSEFKTASEADRDIVFDFLVEYMSDLDITGIVEILDVNSNVIEKAFVGAIRKYLESHEVNDLKALKSKDTSFLEYI